MKIALFFTEGVSLQTWDSVGMLSREIALYVEFIKRGLDVQFVTYGSSGDIGLAKKLSQVEITCNQWNLPPGLYRWSLKTFPPKGDIFKSNQVAGSDVAMIAARKRNKRFVARCGYLLSEFQTHKYGKDSAATKEAIALEKRVFGQADRIVVTTAVMAKTIGEKYRVAFDRISVIPNYVETDRFRPAEGGSRERIRIGFVGRLDQQKNLFALLDALKSLDVELLLIGYGPQHEALATKAFETKVLTVFKGNVPNQGLPALLNTCNLFVLPSLYEGHPKALIEAMACGLPVIGTNVPGIRELIADGKNGLLCEPDAASLRAAIQRAMGDVGLRERLGRAARNFAEEQFSLSRVVDLELAVLNELVG